MRSMSLLECAEIGGPVPISDEHGAVTRRFTMELESRPILKISGTQSSFVTIITLSNGILGTALLTLPNAIHETGLILSVFVCILISALFIYTVYLIVSSAEKVDGGVRMELQEICQALLGKVGNYLSAVSSLLVIVGVVIIYWVLMSEFLFDFGLLLYGEIYGFTDKNNTEVLCTKVDLNTINSTATFEKFWDRQKTVPFYLLPFLASLAFIRSPTFFSKFSCFGFIAIIYQLIFTIIKASHWGYNFNIEIIGSELYVGKHFFVMSGVLSLGLANHNIIMSVLRQQKQPEKNVRDSSIAFLVGSLVYVFVGIIPYITFPLDKSCIQQSIYDNFPPQDVTAIIGRLFLFIHLFTVFPLLVYIVRVQLFSLLNFTSTPSIYWILVINLPLIGLALIFSRFYPQIGDIIRYVGVICGFGNSILVPCLLRMVTLQQLGRRRWLVIVAHSSIIVFGVANMIVQFIS